MSLILLHLRLIVRLRLRHLLLIWADLLHIVGLIQIAESRLITLQKRLQSALASGNRLADIAQRCLLCVGAKAHPRVRLHLANSGQLTHVSAQLAKVSELIILVLDVGILLEILD